MVFPNAGKSEKGFSGDIDRDELIQPWN